MDRRRFLGLAGAGMGLAGVPLATGRQPTRRSLATLPAEYDRNDWYPHVTVAVEQDGTATETITLEGPDHPPSVKLLYSHRNEVDGLEIVEGEEALADNGSIFVWDVEQAATLQFRLPLAIDARHLRNTGVGESSVVADLSELVQVFRWETGPENLPRAHRFTIQPPSGWTAAAPGEKVDENSYEVTSPVITYGNSKRNFFFVGDTDVRVQPAGTQAIRIVEMPAADPVAPLDEAASLLADAVPELERILDHESEYPRLLIRGTTELMGSGGIARRDASFGVSENQRLIDGAGSTLLHELVHTYQRYYRCAGLRDCGSLGRRRRVYSEGGASYLMVYLAYLAGRLDEDGLIQRYRNLAEGGRSNVDDPLSVPAPEAVNGKGAPIHAAIDLDVRARTGGKRDVTDLLAAINDQSVLSESPDANVTDAKALEALYTLTGVDYADFFARYVYGADFPDEFFDGRYALGSAETVEFAAFRYPRAPEPPASLVAGETVTAPIEITNAGPVAGERTLELVVDRETVDAATVELEPSGSTSVSLGHEFDRPGEHDVRLTPLYRTTVTVETDTPTATATPTDTARPASTASRTPPTTTTERSSPTATGGQPGLGLLSGLAGIAGAAWWMNRLCNDRPSAEDE